MVEHVSIADEDRHEAKGASTAANNQVLHANGDGTTSFKFVDYANLVNIPIPRGYSQILTSASTAVSQLPSALDTPLKIEFGSGGATVDVTLDSAGKLTFNTDGDYQVTLFLRFGRTAGAGTSVLFNRFLVNGVQGLNSNSLKLPDGDTVVPFSTTLNFSATAGDFLELEIARDSAGINNGGLYRNVPTTLPWNISPTATMVVTKFLGN